MDQVLAWRQTANNNRQRIDGVGSDPSGDKAWSRLNSLDSNLHRGFARPVFQTNCQFATRESQIFLIYARLDVNDTILPQHWGPPALEYDAIPARPRQNHAVLPCGVGFDGRIVSEGQRTGGPDVQRDSRCRYAVQSDRAGEYALSEGQ